MRLRNRLGLHHGFSACHGIFYANSVYPAVSQRADRVLDPPWRAFLYMPYMHSESLRVHDEALRLFDQPGLEHNLHHEHRHREVLVRFGRYPQRNEALGRASTAEELAFLAQPGNRF